MTTPSTSAVLGVTDSRELVDFARIWYLYGGGREEDILVSFGLTAREFFVRVLAALEVPPVDLPPRVVADIRRVCRARIWLNPAQGPHDGRPE